jgi:tetratricopeptide (TPR) repeat protein
MKAYTFFGEIPIMTIPGKAKIIHPSSQNFLVFISILLVGMVTFFVFSPTLGNDFTNWDDNEYVTNNPDITGFSTKNIVKVFSTIYVGNYQPLTLLSYMADFSISGLNATTFHLTNLLLHCANSILVFLLLAAFVKNPLASLLGALLFALHPLRVESVAWIAERKDVLTAFFYFLSLLTYAYYVKTGRRHLFVVSGSAMILSFLAKPMAVTLPVVMLLFDYLLRRPMQRSIIVEKLPLFILSILFATITILTQHSAGAIQEFPNLSLFQRICVPFYATAFYTIKTFVPINLCALYFQPQQPTAAFKLILMISPIFTAIIATLSYINRNNRALLFGLLFFVVSMLPVIQIIPIGGTIVADRYTYISSVGFCFLAAVAVSWLLKTFQIYGKIILITVAVSIVAVYGFIAYNRCGIWKNSLTLWNDVIVKFPNPTAYLNRGTIFNASGNYPMAIQDFSQVIAIKPDDAMAYNNKGAALLAWAKMRNDSSGMDLAVAEFTKALSIDHKLLHAWFNRANVYFSRKNYAAALADYDSAVAIAPFTAQAYFNRGVFLRETQNFGAAIADFSSAIQCAPTRTAAINERGITFITIGKYDEAINDFKQSLLLDPTDRDALQCLNYLTSIKDSLVNQK